ncbi:mechanosensitive ion channel family protein [Thermanaeromonas sp. C210]|uniref:mechanosensitive ion channel family protein n=1 Tax=Thermanaeromonas sp. C210 TaxID=2731925 RepID=UPI00155CA2D1|nr:mechanosensitive ion channel family protein [Thermanaeromonas sp. C210]GFN22437.1 mechanosensitive ion channel protein MscS [Thermanaeromonas sp. C210]
MFDLDRLWQLMEGPTAVVLQRASGVAAIVLAAVILLKVADRLITRFFDLARIEDHKKKTLETLFRSGARYSIYLLAFLTVLPVLGVNVTALLASAGIVGLAVGFGAQSLVKDLITGFFIIFEDQFRVGDFVQINEKVSGTVEELGLRMTTIREWSGAKYYIANSEIKTVRNYNREQLRAIVTATFPFEENPRLIREVLEQVCREVEREYYDDFLPGENGLAEPPQIYGVTDIDKSERGAQFTIIAKTKPASLWKIERILRERIWLACQERGIKLAYPRRIYEGWSEAEAGRPLPGD